MLLGRHFGRIWRSAVKPKDAQAISEILQLTGGVWEDIYTRFLIGADDVSDGLRKQFLAHRQQAREIFVGMHGEWWKRGLRMRICHALDCYSDKMRYELDQEERVINMLLSDMADLKAVRMPPCTHRRRVVDKAIHYDCAYRKWNGACGYGHGDDCWMCAFFAGGSGFDPKRCTLGLRCTAAEGSDVQMLGKCDSFVPVQALERSKDAEFRLISQRSQKPEPRSGT